MADKTPQIKEREPTTRTTEGMRDTLFDVLDRLTAGRVSSQEAHAVCKLAAQINATVMAEIEFYKHVGRHVAPGKPAPDLVLKLGASARALDKQ